MTTPGTYTVWVREDGLRLDRLLLTAAAGYTPTGDGPAEATRQAAGAPGPRVDLARTLVYTYDRLYRLTGAATSSGEQYAYTYDPVGNRTQMTNPKSQITNYAYDAANRLTQVNGQDYTWDDNGNLVRTWVMTNEWECAASLNRSGRDAANRLVAV